MTTRKRHPFGAASRETHRVSPAYFGDPSNSLYSSQTDIEPTDSVNTGAGSVTDGSIVSGGLDGSIAIKPGTLPGGALDTTPPPAPVLRSVTAGAPFQTEDGKNVLPIVGVVGYDIVEPPPWELSDLSEILVQSTRYPLEGVIPASPDWSRAVEFRVAVDPLQSDGRTDITVTQPDSVPMETYWWVAYALDGIGNRSTPSNVVSAQAGSDVVPPPQPTDIHVVDGMGSFAVRWEAIPATDFHHCEVEYKLAADTTWTRLATGGTLVVVVGVTDGETYNVRVRSVDSSGNTMIPDPGDPPWINAKADLDAEAGWVVADDAHPSNLPGSGFVWTEADIETVFAGNLNADWITVGTLRAGNAPTLPGPPWPPSNPEVQIEVWNALEKKVGRWGTDGITLYDEDHSIGDGAALYEMRIDNASLVIVNRTTPSAPFDAVKITPFGIDASSVTFGSARGGHNLIANSSFEMGAFVATATTLTPTWNVKADWDLTRQGADINVTAAAGALVLTTF